MAQREKTESELYCEIKEAFQIFDRDNDGIITKEEEQTILRMFGINPNEKEDKNTKKDDKKGKEGEQNEDEENADENEEAKAAEEEQEKEQKIETVEFNEFFDNIQRRLGEAINDQQILSEIDTSNILNIRELEHDLQGCKEHISNELIKKIMKDSTPNGGNYVVYEDFVKLMLNKS